MKSIVNWKLFRLLLVAGMFGFIAVLPYTLTIQEETLKELPISLPLALLLSFIQTSILLSVVIFIGLYLRKRVGFELPILSDWIAVRPVKERLKPLVIHSIKLGVLAGTLILVFDYVFTFLINPLESFENIPWQAFLASFYGGIVEEILTRLFLVTLIVWVAEKIVKSKTEKSKTINIWIGIIGAAIIFGLGHLPATALITTITPSIVARAIVLNGIGGIIFGWLYWKKGLFSAMVAHFTTDITILILFPFLISLFA